MAPRPTTGSPRGELRNLERAMSRPSPSQHAIRQIRRNLFGTVDREASRRFVDQELRKQQTQSTERWGFDFGRGRPLEGVQHRYSWEPVGAKTPAKPAPPPAEDTPATPDLPASEDVPASGEVTPPPSVPDAAGEVTPPSQIFALKKCQSKTARRQARITEYWKPSKRLLRAPSKKMERRPSATTNTTTQAQASS